MAAPPSFGGEQTLGLYLSIPFCRSKCTFCNFASGVYPAADHGRYVQRLCEELRGARQQAERCGLWLPRRVDSVYLGGGTPSLLAPELLKQIFATLRSEFSLAPDAEVTMECAPGQIADDVLAAMAECGVNRASLGVQSFIDREAAVSGRLHNRAAALADLARLRAAGIERLSLDLIAGLAHQTLESWRESLRVLLDTGVEHASVYMLEVDDESRLGKEMLAGGGRYHAGAVPKDDTIAAMFEEAAAMLIGAGLEQYEISNFAVEGAESKHNLKYWHRRPYLGVGVDAHSMLREREQGGAVRFADTDELGGFLEGSSFPWKVEVLSRREELEEAWFLGLRLGESVSVRPMQQEFGADAFSIYSLRALRELQDAGLVCLTGGSVQLTDRGKLVSNEVFARILEVGDEEACLTVL